MHNAQCSWLVHVSPSATRNNRTRDFLRVSVGGGAAAAAAAVETGRYTSRYTCNTRNTPLSFFPPFFLWSLVAGLKVFSSFFASTENLTSAPSFCSSAIHAFAFPPYFPTTSCCVSYDVATIFWETGAGEVFLSDRPGKGGVYTKHGSTAASEGQQWRREGVTFAAEAASFLESFALMWYNKPRENEKSPSPSTSTPPLPSYSAPPPAVVSLPRAVLLPTPPLLLWGRKEKNEAEK